MKPAPRQAGCDAKSLVAAQMELGHHPKDLPEGAGFRTQSAISWPSVYATAAANEANRSPGSACLNRQVIAMGLSFSWLT